MDTPMGDRSIIPPDAVHDLMVILNRIDEAKVPGDIAEIGAYRCGTTVDLAAAVPGRKVFAFDVFGGLPYGAEQNAFHGFADADVEEVRKFTGSWANVELVVGKHEETIPEFSSRPMSLIFVDSDFESSHRVAIEHFKPMLSEGGSFVFDDQFEDCVRAMNDLLPVEQWTHTMLPSGMRQVTRIT